MRASTNAWVGARIELVSMLPDGWTGVKPGDRGTITMIDDGLTFHVKWDNGSNLGLIPGADLWKLVTE